MLAVCAVPELRERIRAAALCHCRRWRLRSAPEGSTLVLPDALFGLSLTLTG
jgi:hypothetical protein